MTSITVRRMLWRVRMLIRQVVGGVVVIVRHAN